MSDDLKETPSGAEHDDDDKNQGSDDKNPEGNVANRYFSVEVTPPAGVAAESGDHGEGPEYNYFRMGGPYEELEAKLPINPYEKARKAEGKTPWEHPGIVLFTTGKYQRSAKHAVTSSSEEIDVVSDGKKLVSAKCTIGGHEAWEVSYKNLVDVTATIGYIIETTTGGIQDFWTGQYVHLGYGATMHGAFGLMADVHGGQHIELGVGLFGLEGLGHLEAAEHFSVISSGPLRLSSDPAHAHLADDASTWRLRLSKAAKLALLISPALLTLGAQVAPAGVWRADEGSLEKLKKGMIGTGSEALALAALFTVIHVGLSLAAAVIRLKEVPASVADDLASKTSVVLRMDGDLAGMSYLKVGDRWLTFEPDRIDIINSEGSVLTAPAITLMKDSIELSVGQSSIKIDSNGVTINGTAVQCNGGNATLDLANQTAALSGTTVTLNQVDAATLAQTQAVAQSINVERVRARAILTATLAREVPRQIALAAAQQARLAALDSVD